MASGESTACGYKFVSEPADKLKCQICLKVAKEPLRHKSCGRLFCKECIAKLGKGKPCPSCKLEQPVFTLSKRSKRTIQSLRVKCTNVYRGTCCDWEGTGALVEAHMATCKVALIPCPNQCRDEAEKVQKVGRKALAPHLNKDCPHREVKCAYCEQLGTYAYTTHSHVEVCPAMTFSCPHVGCTPTIQHEHIANHLETCEHALVPCKYKNIGCKCELKRKDLTKHEEEADKAHLHLALDAIVTMQDSNSSLKCNNTLLGKTVERLEISLQDAAPMVAQFLQRTHNELEVVRDENANATALSILQGLKVEKTLNTFTSTFTFKITNCQEIRKGTGRFISEPFYTRGSSGYHMAIHVFLNGSNGPDVSVFVTAVVGKFDDKLAWPFTGDVMITILNQLKDEGHHCHTLGFSPKHNLRPGCQPFGLAEFLPQEKCYNRHRDKQYFMDDALYFRIFVRESRPWLICSN